MSVANNTFIFSCKPIVNGGFWNYHHSAMYLGYSCMSHHAVFDLFL